MSAARIATRIALPVAGVAVLFLVARLLGREGGGAGAADPPAAPSAGGPAGARPVPVLTAPVEKRDVPVWIEGLGTVVAWTQVTVHPEVDGRLDRVLFTEGQAVRRGQQLAQIDPRPFEVQLHQGEGALARDEAQLRGARLDLVRYVELRKRNLGSQQQVDQQAALVGQLEGTVRVDRASIESAKLNLDWARVTAPVDGVVGVRLVDPGNLVHATDQTGLVVLTKLDPAAVLVTLPEDDLPAVAAAQARGEVPVEAWSRDGAVKLGAGRLLVIDNQINSATATMRVKAVMPNPWRSLWPNLFVKGRLLVDTRRGALVVPVGAVQHGPQGTLVWIVGADHRASPRDVVVALTAAEVAVIARGVSAGETVVVEGQGQLRPGAEVSVAEKGGSEPRP